MKKWLTLFIFIVCLQFFVFAQVPTVAATNTVQIADAKTTIDNTLAAVKQKNAAAFDLRKQAAAKRILAAKEKNKEVAEQLKNEAKQLDESAKQKLAEAKILQQNANELKKQNTNIASNIGSTGLIKPNINGVNNNEVSTWVEIYELPHYQGRKIRFTENSTNLAIPFPIGTLSIKKSKSPYNVVLSVGNNSFTFSKYSKFSSYGEEYNKVYEDVDSVLYNSIPQTINNLSVFFEPIPYIEVFQFPNYQGSSVKFYTNTRKKITLPFISNNISIKFSNENNTIAYIENTRATPKIKILVKSLYSYYIDAKTINFIQVGTKKKLEVDFNGVLYDNVNNAQTIHNNDCKKLYGNISFTISYKGDRQTTELLNVATNEIGSTVTLFNKERGTDYVCPFIYSTNEHPLNDEMSKLRGRQRGNTNGEMFLKTIADVPNAKQVFYIDSLSYCKLFANDLSLTTDVKIGSAHKGCDACTDFTWDAAMIANSHQFMVLPNPKNNVNIPGVTGSFINLINIGPFRETALGRNVNSNYTGPAHPTYIQLTAKIIN